MNENENSLTQLLLYGDRNMSDHTNTFLWNSAINYIVSTKCFDNPWKSSYVPRPYNCDL